MSKTYCFYEDGKLIDSYKFFKNYPNMISYIDDREIPEDFLYNSYHNRMKLLRGIMDNAGYIRKGDRRHSVTFSFRSDKLINQIKILIMGLGYNAFKISNLKDNAIKDLGLFISVPNIFKTKMFTHPAKYKLAVEGMSELERKLFGQLVIKDIMLIGKKMCKGIITDSENGLYLTNDFIVTHN